MILTEIGVAQLALPVRKFHAMNFLSFSGTI